MTESKWKRFEKLIHEIHQQFGKGNITLDERLPGFDSKLAASISISVLTAPTGKESNWLPTAGEDFFLILRLYGPEKPYFDKTWKMNDIERN